MQIVSSMKDLLLFHDSIFWMYACADLCHFGREVRIKLICCLNHPAEGRSRGRAVPQKGAPAEGRSGESAVRRREAAQPQTHTATHTNTHTHPHTHSPTHTLQHTNTHTPTHQHTSTPTHTLMSSIFVPEFCLPFCPFFFAPSSVFFIFCPVRLFFCPVCRFFILSRQLFAYFVPFAFFFFCPVAFLFCPATARRGALDWLFDRINLDPKIQMNHVESNNQLADISTEGNFTRDEGIICCICFDIMSNTTFTCSHFFVPKRKQSVAISKRSQESFSTDDSPTVKARSRTFTLVSQKCWSAKQSSSTSNPTISGSTRTEGVSSSIGKPTVWKPR